MKKIFLSTLGGCLLGLSAQAQWVNQPISYTPGLVAFYLDAIDANTAWSVGSPTLSTSYSAPQVARTTNAGQTWATSNPPVDAANVEDFTSFCAIDASNAWMTVKGPRIPGRILHTNNGGQNWTVQSSASVYGSRDSFPDMISFLSATEGITVGDPLQTSAPLELYRTTNGGTTWDAVLNSPATLTNEYPLSSPPAVVGNDIWFCTSKGRVFHSGDKGLTWTATVVDGSVSSLWKVAFRDARNGLACILDEQGQQHRLYRTTDGGATWTNVAYTGPLHGLGLSKVPGSAYYVSTGTNIGNGDTGSSYSRDNGQTWVSMETRLDHYITEFVSPTVGWSASFSLNPASGSANRYSGNLLATHTDAALQAGLSVSPNPAAGGRFSLQSARPVGSSATVRVFNVAGRLVQQLAWTGTTPLDLDLSQQAAGLYVLEVQSANGTARQKIVVQ